MTTGPIDPRQGFNPPEPQKSTLQAPWLFASHLLQCMQHVCYKQCLIEAADMPLNTACVHKVGL